MFKNSYYNKNKNIIKVPKHTDKHDIKSDIKPNVNKNNNYENIRNIVENSESEKKLNPDKKDIKKKLNIF